MRATIFLTALALVSLSTQAAAQFRSAFTIKDDVLAATGIQIYLDFDPDSVPSATPPVTPDAEDILAIVRPIPDSRTSNAFAIQIIDQLNTEFRRAAFPATFEAFIRFTDPPEEQAHDSTIEIVSSVELLDIFMSNDHTLPPDTKISPPPGIAFNATFANLTNVIQNAHPGLPQAQMRINGQNPANDDLHQIKHPLPGTISISYFSGPMNPGRGLTILTANDYHPQAAPAASFLGAGSLDIGTPMNPGPGIGGITVFADGITLTANPTTDPFFHTDSNGQFTMTFTLDETLAGHAFATQCIIADPLHPLGIGFTQAADVNFARGRTEILNTSSDGTVVVDLLPGYEFPFFGTSYTQLIVNENGIITFGGNPVAVQPFQIDPAQILGGPPSIFVNLADWDTTSSGGVVFKRFGAEVRLKWGSFGNPVTHANGADLSVFGATLHTDAPPNEVPRNQIELVNGPMSSAENSGSIFLDYLQLNDPTAASGVFDSVVGVSPGGLVAITGVASVDLLEPAFPAAGGQALVSQFNQGNTAINPLNANDAPQFFNNGSVLDRRTISFFPVEISNTPGFYSLPSQAKRDSFEGADIDTLSLSVNQNQPTIFNLIGHFEFLSSINAFAPLPVVQVISPSAGILPLPLNLLGIMSSGASPVGVIATIARAPGFRDFEGARVVIPQGALLGGMYPPGSMLGIRVVFPTGQNFFIPNLLTVTP